MVARFRNDNLEGVLFKLRHYRSWKNSRVVTKNDSFAFSNRCQMNWSTLAEDQLIALVKNGDENAFREIYTRYWKQLFFIAYKKLHDKK
jgi:hypothetical protein